MDHDEIISRAAPLLALIRRIEARSDYNIVYGGIPASLRPAKLTSMSIDGVLAWQDRVVAAGAKSSAAGAYQIIRRTLRDLAPVVGSSAIFNARTQDLLAAELLIRRGVVSFLEGEIGPVDMMLPLAKEWASFPVPSDSKGASRLIKAGQSYYAGDGLNKALVSVDEVLAALSACRRGPYPAPSAPIPSAPASAARSIWQAIIDLLKGVWK